MGPNTKSKNGTGTERKANKRTKLTKSEGSITGYGIRMFKTMGLASDDEAMKMIRRIGSLVQPLMVKHLWVLPLLREFVPDDPTLLGVNINKGQEIRLRLRHPGSTCFFDFNFIMGTMLHELTHNIRSTHDAQFYKVMDDLANDFERMQVARWKIAGFGTPGIKLGWSGGNLSATDSREVTFKAAEQRAHKARIMIPAGGRTLGGSSSGSSFSILEKSLPLREMAARAAERRQRDRVWCGSSESDAVQIMSVKPSSSHVYISDDSSNDESEIKPKKRPRVPVISQTSSQIIFKRPSTICPASQNNAVAQWKCTSCTWTLNLLSSILCEACLTPNQQINSIHKSEIIESIVSVENKKCWICESCSLQNQISSLCCNACERPSPSVLNQLDVL
ncbi:hypothetical protein HK100_011955 [Physocladia obscura]|uniref:WLM-domain-containing protein n=1 Tax=Physocladia obscura TaxID=109957 RepID=A0AAD5T988_9FUNG|nr:hypothetical protein HK100_011955 [Physocladia obscura]